MSKGPVSHLAGAVVSWQGRFMRQRCLWCGEILIDYDVSRMAVAVEDGEEPRPPATWSVEQFVRVDGHASSLVSTDENDRTPEDACFHLPQEETA